MFYCRCFPFLFQHKICKLRWPIGAKFCIVVITRPNFIMLVQNFEGPTPKKILGAKNMQNLARFWMTSKFGSEYIQNQTSTY